MKSIISRTLFFLSFFGASLLLANTPSKMYFLNPSSWNFHQIIPSPATKTPEGEARDINFLKDTMAARTKKQLFRALIASSDSIFDYSPIISPAFNANQLPYSTGIFKEVKSDTDKAIHIAKNEFHRSHPTTWNETKKNGTKISGYSYPSGHSTRAFVWAGLLTDLFPKKRKEIEIEARTKAWNRVILGRHYPDDVYAGEVYGQFLARQFLANPIFQRKWMLIKEEINNAGIRSLSSNN
ncbi:MAG: phosphatase PAP2 family protein [Verrucomicrobiae bacterium]|nr:phosphatase PAP2 family protein [Verrucomicrobiae bacterium]